MREEFKNIYDNTKLIFTEDGIEFYSRKRNYNIPYSCISKISVGAMSCVNIKTTDKTLLTFRDPDGNKDKIKKMVAYAQNTILDLSNKGEDFSEAQKVVTTGEFILTPSEENEIKTHKKSIIILFFGISCMLSGYFFPILGGIGGLIIVIGFIMFFKFRSKSAIYYEKRKAKAMATNMVLNTIYKTDLEIDPDVSKASSRAETKKIIKGAVVGGIIGGDAGAVIGTIAQKNKIDNKKKNKIN